MKRNPRLVWDMSKLTEEEQSAYVASLTPEDFFDFLNEILYRFCPEMAEEIYRRNHPEADSQGVGVDNAS